MRDAPFDDDARRAPAAAASNETRVSPRGWVAHLLRPREPFNAWSHALGVVLALAGWAVLLARADTAPQWVAVCVYSLTMTGLFVMSTAVHADSDLARVDRLDRADRVAIYLFIAGTYTPTTLSVLEGGWRLGILLAIWIQAGLGTVAAGLGWTRPRWLTTGIYVLMGCTIFIAAVPLGRALDGWSLFWLIAGGASYTLGAVVFALRRPDPWPRVFGFHGLWHLAVLGGAASHYVLIYRTM